MKKINLLIVMFLLVGCSSPKGLPNLATKPIDLSTKFFQSPMAVAKGDIYYVQDEVLYHYMISTKTRTELTTTVGLVRDSDIVYYDGYIYGVFEESSKNGTPQYALKRYNSNGEDLQKVISFSDFPERFKIDSGKIYVLFGNECQRLSVYNHNFNFIETLEISTDVDGSGLFFNNGNMYIPKSPFEIYEGGLVKTSYEIVNGPTSSKGETRVTGIFTKGTNEIKLDNKVVMYVSDNYFYATNLQGQQTYEKYNHTGELISEVIPKESLNHIRDISTMFWLSDFAMIERIVDDRYAIGRSITDFYICDFETGTCSYLGE